MPCSRHVLFWILLLLVLSPCARSAEPTLSLSEADGQKWYRGNMHTHSLWSDGDDYPEMIAAWYRDQRYDFLVFTDHNVLLQGDRWIDVEKNKGGQAAFDKLIAEFPDDWVQTRTIEERKQVRLSTFDEMFDRLAMPQEFLLIQGEEITDTYKNLPVHMCVTNTTELLPPLHGDSVLELMQRNIDAAVSRRERSGEKSLIHLNHPNYKFGVTAEQLMHVIGENFFEIYNGVTESRNSGDAVHASTSRIWDIVNTWRLSQLDLPIMYALAADDGHTYHLEEPGGIAQPGRGWVMVLAETLTPDALVSALEAGRFYASSGVSLDSIVVADNELTVEVMAEEGITYRIDFIGTRKGFNATTSPAVEDENMAAGMTRVYSDDVGTVLKSVTGSSASYRMTGDELYVRAVVTSSRRHPNPSEKGDFEQAWIQPIRPEK